MIITFIFISRRIVQNNSTIQDKPIAAWVWVGLAIAVVASRAAGLPSAPDDHDAANFLRALENYDLAIHSPHFPGYPVYIALARTAYVLGAPAAAALAWPSIVAGALASVAVGRSVPRLGVVAALAYAVLPGLWLADLAPRPDALATHVLVIAACALLAAPSRWTMAAPLLGLSLGIRLSNWLVVLVLVGYAVWAAQPAAKRMVAAVFVASVALWAIPLVVVTGGPVALGNLAVAFGQGHFAQWGNTALGQGDVLWTVRTLTWGGHLLSWAALGPAVAVVAVGVVLHLRRRAVPTALLMLGVAMVAHAAWLAVGQNPDHPRHVLPIAGLLTLAAVWVAAAHRWAMPQLAALVACGLAVTAERWPLLAQPAPEVALAQFVRDMDAEQTALAGGSEIAVIRAIAPQVRALRVPHGVDVERALAPAGHWPVRALATSRAFAGQAPTQWHSVAQFAARIGVDPPGAGLTLYQRDAHRSEVVRWP